MDTHGHHHETRELDHRSGDGVDITLLWSSRPGVVTPGFAGTRPWRQAPAAESKRA